MQRIFSYGKMLFLSLFIIGMYNSCTDLDEEVFDRVTTDNFFQSDEEFISALGGAYSALGNNWGGHNGTWSTQEVSTDEFIVPQRGQDWFDGGIWLRCHRHEWTPTEPWLNNSWNSLFGGVNSCNRVIDQFTALNVEGSDAFIAELKVLRALFYIQLMDIFGNVPIVTSFEVTEPPTNSSRTEVFNFIESDILANIDLLTEQNGGAAYGRINKWTAHAMLTKLYLNAEVYTGTPRWNDVITQADAVINSGNFALESNYFANFNATNDNSSENIFVKVYDRVFAGGFNIPAMTLHYNSQFTFDLTFQPWNGYCSLQEFYNSYSDDDVRKASFLEGPQFASDGSRIIDNGAEEGDPDGPPLTFTPELNEHFPGAFRQAGVRAAKFEYVSGATQNLDNDFPIYRYADILLSKAEALMRLNGEGDAEALALINQVHERAGLDPYDTITFDELLAERGREMFMEAVRRQDLIRFGVWGDPWEFKPASDAEVRKIFPIPTPQLDANKSLVQNPGY